MKRLVQQQERWRVLAFERKCSKKKRERWC